MSISYPSIILGGGLSSNTGSFSGSFYGYLSGNALVTDLTASTVSASNLYLANDPYAKAADISSSFAILTASNVFTGQNHFNNTTYFLTADFTNNAIFNGGLTAHNTVVVDGTNNSNYAYLFIQGSTESHLKIRHGFTEVGDLYNSGNDLVLSSTGKLSITGSTAFNSSVTANAFTGSLVLTGAIYNANSKVSVNSPSSTGIVDQVTGSTRGAKYTILVETTSGPYHVQSMDVIMASNGSSILITPYAVACTSGSYLASFDAQYNGATIELVATKITSYNIAVSMTKTYLS